MESPLTELKFGIVDSIAALHETERQAAGPALERGEIAVVGRLHEGLMTALQHGREAADLTPIQRRQAPPHLEFAQSGGLCSTESTGSGDAAHECAVAPALVADAESTSRVAQIENKAVGRAIELVTAVS